MIQPYTRPKLSDLMRTGARMHPQAFRWLIEYNEHGQPGTCAIGAAYTALTGHLPEDDMTLMQALWVLEDELAIDFSEDQVRVPGGTSHTLSWYIVHLNDNQHWTRERIADFLAEQGY